jgi:hypothetical protein
MPPKKCVSSSAAAPKITKRPRPPGTASQPIPIAEIQLPVTPSSSDLSPCILSTLSPPTQQALPDASQATSTFESQLRDSRPEAAIVAPTNGSEEATVASSHTADEPFDGDFEDNYEGIDWSRLLRFMKPPASSRRRPSWIY